MALQGAVTQGLAGFFRWWGGELAACLPVRARGRFGRSRQQLLIEVSDTAARLTYQKNRGQRLLGTLAISSPDVSGQRDSDVSEHRDTGQRAAVTQMIRKAGVGSVEVVLTVPREKVLRRRVELPIAAGENLREVLGFEMDRHTPFKTDEVYFDYRIDATDSERKRIKVDLVVVPRPIADQAVRVVRSWGLAPDRLAIDEGLVNGVTSFNLLPPGVAREGSSVRHWLTGLLAVMVCALLAIDVYLPLDQKREQLAQLQAQLTQVQAEAVQADGMRKQIEALLERGRFVVERKHREPSATEVLDELTRLLPDHTWVLKLGLRDKKLTLSGYSAKPSSLIGLLERSDMLKEVRFSSPVTMDQRIGLERFNLTATVADRGQS